MASAQEVNVEFQQAAEQARSSEKHGWSFPSVLPQGRFSPPPLLPVVRRGCQVMSLEDQGGEEDLAGSQRLQDDLQQRNRSYLFPSIPARVSSDRSAASPFYPSLHPALVSELERDLEEDAPLAVEVRGA